MRKAKSSIVIALLLALPIEAVSFRFAFFPIDIGLPPDAKWYVKVRFYQWLFLHWPGLWFLNWFDGTRFEYLGLFLLAATGYVDTALLIIAGIFVFHGVRHVTRSKGATSQTL